MDINTKLAQRRIERVLERERESLELIEKNKSEKKIVEAEAIMRLKDEGFQKVLDAHAESMIKKEKDRLIKKIARSKFSTNENMFGLVYIAVTIWVFLNLWWFGLILIFIGILFYESLIKKYINQITAESNIEELK